MQTETRWRKRAGEGRPRACCTTSEEEEEEELINYPHGYLRLWFPFQERAASDHSNKCRAVHPCFTNSRRVAGCHAFHRASSEHLLYTLLGRTAPKHPPGPTPHVQLTLFCLPAFLPLDEPISSLQVFPLVSRLPCPVPNNRGTARNPVEGPQSPNTLLAPGQRLSWGSGTVSCGERA